MGRFPLTRKMRSVRYKEKATETPDFLEEYETGGVNRVACCAENIVSLPPHLLQMGKDFL